MLTKIAAIRRAMEAREHVDSVPRFLADTAKLLAGVLRDPRVPRSAKVAAGAAGVYVMSPLDLIPDIPVIGQVDDLWLVGLTLRWLVRASGEDVVREHWGGDDRSYRALQLLVGIDP